MAETLEQPTTRRGNPNFAKKAAEPVSTTGPKKGLYIFKLIKSHESLKPVNNVTLEIDDNPYPHYYIAANSGVAWDETTEQERRWRFLYGYASIWVDEQQNPKPDDNRLSNSDGKNDIVFLKGFLKVRAGDGAKLKALQVNDGYEGNKNPINVVPPIFELVDADKARLDVRNAADRQFEAESAARGLDYIALFGVALALGIDVNDPDMIQETRTSVIFKSKENPENFLKVVNDPRHKIKYLAARAMNEMLLVQQASTLIYQGTAWLTVNPNQDLAHQVAQMVLAKDKKATELYDSLKEYYNV